MTSGNSPGGYFPSALTPPPGATATPHDAMTTYLHLERGERRYLGYHEYAVHPDDAQQIIQAGHVTINGVELTATSTKSINGFPVIRVDGLDAYGDASDPRFPALRALNGLPPVEHPPGTIIIAAGEFLRYGAFVNSMLQTEHPPGTSIFIKQSVAIVENLNDCIRMMTGDWVWIQADDQSWHKDALVRLLDCDVDVVVPLILKRSPPYHPVAFSDYQEGEGYLPFSLADLPESGLVEVVAAGSGGMLIRKHVLDAIGDPWFTYGDGETLNEDLRLCRRIRDAGYPIHLCVDVQFGHRGTMTVQPVLEDGRWSVGLNMGPTSNGKSNTIVIEPAAIGGEEASP